MQAMLRRVTVQIEVTTAQGEKRTIKEGNRAGEPVSASLLDFVRATMAAHQLELVDERELPISTAAPVVSTLTASAAVALPPPPSPVEPASPSAAPPATGDLSPARKRAPIVSAPAALAPTAQKVVIQDAHRRIEPTRLNRADVVIGPRDVTAVGGALRVSSAHVVGQPQHQHQITDHRQARRAALFPAAAPLPAQSRAERQPDFTAPALKGKR